MRVAPLQAVECLDGLDRSLEAIVNAANSVVNVLHAVQRPVDSKGRMRIGEKQPLGGLEEAGRAIARGRDLIAPQPTGLAEHRRQLDDVVAVERFAPGQAEEIQLLDRAGELLVFLEGEGRAGQAALLSAVFCT